MSIICSNPSFVDYNLSTSHPQRPGTGKHLNRQDWLVMARLESLDAPLLRVSRPVSACSRCRGAKVKCDGRLPACGACKRLGRANECSSANDLSAKGKERSYVAALESKVEKLERKLAQGRNRKASVTMFDTQLSGGMDNLANSSRQPTLRRFSGGRAAQMKEASNVDDLVSDFGFL